MPPPFLGRREYMLVKLKNSWFASTPRVTLNPVFSTVGRRYKAGVHEMPEEYRDILPSTAVVLDEPPVEEVKPEPVSLKDFDDVRAAGNAVDEVVEKAEKAAAAPKEKAKK
jgi:hypothetical protein